MVIIVCFPQLARKSKVVVTVVGDKLISTDFVPFFSCRNLGCTQIIDPQTNCGAPGNCVLYKLHFLAVIGKKERAGPFQTLFRGNCLVAFEVEFCSDRSVWPYNTDYIGACLFAQAEVNYWTGYRLLLNQQPRPDFHLSTDTKRIDSLISGGRRCARADYLPMIVF